MEKTAKPVYVTPQGLAKLEDELNYLLTTKRVEIAEGLHDAQSGGDNLDNTEYQAILYEQLLLEMRISQLQQLVSAAQLIELGNGDGVARLGSTVVIQDGGGLIETYLLVGSAEADPDQGRISDECPLGSAILHRRAGETVEVQTPDGYVHYRLLAVT